MMVAKRFLPNYCIDLLWFMLFMVTFFIIVLKDVAMILLSMFIVVAVICVAVFSVSTIIVVNQEGVLEKKGFKKPVLKFAFKGVCDIQILDSQHKSLQKDAISRELVLNNDDTRYRISINNYNERTLLAELSKYI